MKETSVALFLCWSLNWKSVEQLIPSSLMEEDLPFAPKSTKRRGEKKKRQQQEVWLIARLAVEGKKVGGD